MPNPVKIVGRCWCCRYPVERQAAVWLDDRSVISPRTARPLRRLVHRGDCAGRAETLIRAAGVQSTTSAEGAATGETAPTRTFGALTFHIG